MESAMKQLLEFLLGDDGGTILVEVEEPAKVATQRVALGRDQLAYKAKESFNAALKKVVRPTAVALITEMRGLPDPPNEIEARFGIKMSMEVGAVITAGGESNFEITLKWKGE
jgi:hypothetical protein